MKSKAFRRRGFLFNYTNPASSPTRPPPPLAECVAYLSFLIDQTKSCDLLLNFKVKRRSDGVTIKVSSADPSQLAAALPTPHPTTSKNFRLLLKDGVIVLRPLPLGQTSFTVTAKVMLGEVRTDDTVAIKKSSSKVKTGRLTIRKSNVLDKGGTKILGGTDGAKTNELFCRLSIMLYDRFKLEPTIDARK